MVVHLITHTSRKPTTTKKNVLSMISVTRTHMRSYTTELKINTISRCFMNHSCNTNTASPVDVGGLTL